MNLDNQKKDIIAYCFAGFSLLCGFGLAVAGFIVDPTGQIHDSVLWVLAQTLMFAGAICGVTMYVNNTVKSLKNKISSDIKSAVKDELNNTEYSNKE